MKNLASYVNIQFKTRPSNVLPYISRLGCFKRRLAVRAFTLIRSAVPEDAVPHAVVADEKHSRQENHAADGAWLAHQEKAGQVEDNEHGVVVDEGWV